MKVPVRGLVALLLLTLLAPIPLLSHAQARGAGPRHRPGRVWVCLKAGDPTALRRRASALGEGQLDAVVAELHGAILQVPEGQEAQVARRLAARAEVAYALPIPQAQALETPNDPYFSSQWGLAKVDAPQAWDAITNTRPITIAVIDTGVELGHPDLAGRIWTNPGEIPGNGIDDDGNGYVDDVHGWSFVSGTADPDDDHGHGTHVSGIAAASTDNGVGVAGLDRWACILPVKVLDNKGSGSDDNIARGIIYAVDNGARVINLSLGGADAFPPLQEALAYAGQHGVLVVAAAGNDGGPLLYPAAYPEAMAVAATDSSDLRVAKATYGWASNVGPQLSVAAPGAGIYSTYRGGSYTYMSGTSMATPHVAGLAALVWSTHAAYSPSQVRRTIELTAQDVNAATLPGPDDQLGYGRIDANRAVRAQMRSYYLPYVVSPP